MSNPIENGTRESWGSRIGFILATAGFSVGIGNIWRFPYLVGQYGGAVFIIVYLLVLFVLGIILFTAEISIGRAGRANASQSFKNITGDPKTKWSLIGILGLIAVGIIASFAPVVIGWSLAYLFRSLAGTFSGLGVEEIGGFFQSFIGSYECIIWSLVVMVLTTLVVTQGLKKGIERMNKILMPGLFSILLILLIRALTLPNAAIGLEFYLRPDLTKLGWDTLFAAMGQVFFSVGIAMSVGLVFGSYLSKDYAIPPEASKIAFIDTAVACLAGLVIVPSALAFGINPGAGPGLVFVTMPNVFNNMPLGNIVGAAFYLMFFIAGFTSEIASVEAIASWVTEQFDIPRNRAVPILSSICFLISVPCALGMGIWSGVSFFGRDILGTLDFIASNICLPIGAMLMTFFVVHKWGFDNFKKEANTGKAGFIMVEDWWHPLLKYIIPIIVFIIFINGLGLL